MALLKQLKSGRRRELWVLGFKQCYKEEKWSRDFELECRTYEADGVRYKSRLVLSKLEENKRSPGARKDSGTATTPSTSARPPCTDWLLGRGTLSALTARCWRREASTGTGVTTTEVSMATTSCCGGECEHSCSPRKTVQFSRRSLPLLQLEEVLLSKQPWVEVPWVLL